MKTKRISLLSGIVLGALAVFTHSASAVIMTTGFNIDFNSGPRDGQNAMGEIRYDDMNLLGTGMELMGPISGMGSGVPGIVAFDVTIGPDIFAINSGMLLSFQDGDLKGILYSGNGSDNGDLDIDSPSNVNPNPFPASVEYQGDLDDEASTGTISLKTPRNGVPEPGSTAVLMALGLVALAVSRKRSGV